MATTLDDIIKEQNNILEYIEKADLKESTNFIILLGERAIGKTHLIITEMYKRSRADNSAFMIMFRIMTQQTDIHNICAKYGYHISGNHWKADGGNIYEIDSNGDVTLIGYYSYINAADRLKTKTYDNPRVTQYFFDEVYSFQPVKSEARKFVLTLGTVNRSLNNIQNGLTVWLAGNDGMGVSPILEAQKIDTSQNKWRSKNTVLYRSTLKSADESLNIKPQAVKPMEIKGLQPTFSWTYNGVGYECYQLENHLYVKESNKKGQPLNGVMVKELTRLYFNQKDIVNPIFYENMKCLHLSTFIKHDIF